MWDFDEEEPVDFDEEHEEHADEDEVCGDRILSNEDRRRWYAADTRGEALGSLSWEGLDNPAWED